MQMSTGKAHMGAAEGIPGPSQMRSHQSRRYQQAAPSTRKSQWGCVCGGGGEDKEGLGKQQLYANFPTDILWVFAIRNNSITTYVKGL